MASDICYKTETNHQNIWSNYYVSCVLHPKFLIHMFTIIYHNYFSYALDIIINK